MNHRSAAALISVLLVAVTGCASGQEVGSDKLKNFEQQKNQPQLGQRTTAPATKAPAKKPATKAPVPVVKKTTATRPPAPRATRSPAAQVLRIDINSDDTTSTQLNPTNVTVFKGTIVTWVNRDSKPRGIASEDGKTFTSPPIAPGKTWSWTASKTGAFAYADSTRPYVTGNLTVRTRG